MTQLARRAGRMPSVFDNFFNNPWNNWLGDVAPAKLMNVPFVNISERENEYLVSMAAPGFKKDDFKIDVEGDTLTISSEKKEEKKEEEERFSREEYSYSSFERCFALPREVNKEMITAEYKDGILNIELPKKEEAKMKTSGKKIEVK